MPFRLKKTVAMVGMMGAGKTAIGSALAERLNVPFRDSDAEIVLAANASIAEIFERDGEAFFRERESEVIQRLMTATPAILSTGGGAFLRKENRLTISDKGASVWLRAELELLWQRVKHKTTRPLLRTDDPRRTLSEIKDQRDPIYSLADITVDADFDLSIENMTDRVIEALSHRPDILERTP